MLRSADRALGVTTERFKASMAPLTLNTMVLRGLSKEKVNLTKTLNSVFNQLPKHNDILSSVAVTEFQSL